MFDFITKVFLYFDKVEVVHSLPGRLRIYAPVAKMIPENLKVDNDWMNRLFSLIPGVNTVSFSPVTSSLLIHYDPGKTTEERVLAYIDNMIQIIKIHNKELQGVNENNLQETLNKFYHLVKNNLHTISSKFTK
ncbi:hypothetical protein CACET_c29490 [Clostridium aceticum]|uniref:Uncharacterized protein n=1 Tax=Clostridium aceticum TaxID=84022 RepID=A0A0D8IAA5_9CLOT|nr:hypothetical protein [Clostridium aceticum]AKL96393.1 hypothetical protein CACET_c29490 [Clostridium aceticum]KJF26969.1 hypothetical protein TZ02_10615 [Clostridium aceticum]